MIQQHVLACLLGAFIILIWPDSASAACMSRAYDDVPQVPQGKRGQSYQILAADEDVAFLEAKGFRSADCSAELTELRSQLDYRNGLCAFVAEVNYLVEAQAERALGAPPELLCTSAEKLLGRWNGEPGPAPPEPQKNSRRIVHR